MHPILPSAYPAHSLNKAQTAQQHTSPEIVVKGVGIRPQAAPQGSVPASGVDADTE